MIIFAAAFLFVRSIISVAINENEHNGYNNQFLKTNILGCTFSIGLADMLDEGWGGNYVTVNVGQNNHVPFTRIQEDSNPV